MLDSVPPTMTSIPTEPITIALTGDVMTGRGIDQVLPKAGDPTLYESYVQDAREYVGLAVQASGNFATPVDFDYVWGDARDALQKADIRIVNLETSVTSANEPWPRKGINYRMHPGNVGCLIAARVDCCGLANNHVLDWGYDGLTETLRTLREAGVVGVGAGQTLTEAAAPATLPVANKGRVLVAAMGSTSSGIPATWAATAGKPGIQVVPTLSEDNARRVAHDLLRVSRPNDITVVSIHWGGNWGYEIDDAQIEFAHVLADEGIDVIHGHSSHHAKAIELRRSSVILYGCGDFLNDYEGISGHEEFRGDLVILYQVSIRAQPRQLVDVTLRPFQIRRFRLNDASANDAQWLCARLNSESARFSTTVEVDRDNHMIVRAAAITDQR
jgi:poly-gamma-glutamate synthesis protein (capsule biosynthesis protein)